MFTRARCRSPVLNDLANLFGPPPGRRRGPYLLLVKKQGRDLRNQEDEHQHHDLNAYEGQKALENIRQRDVRRSNGLKIEGRAAERW